MSPKSNRYPYYLRKILTRVLGELQTVNECDTVDDIAGSLHVVVDSVNKTIAGDRVLARVSTESRMLPSIDVIVKILRSLNFKVGKPNSSQLPIYTDDLNHVILKFFQRYNDIDTRLDWIRGTLPDAQNRLSSWKSLEFRRVSWGFSPTALRLGDTFWLNTDFFRDLLNSSFFYFTVGHNDNYIALVQKTFPNCRQIRFINTKNWIDYCLSQGKRFQHKPNIRESKRITNGVDFDVETFFSSKAFLSGMRMLYQYFDLPDYDDESIAEFYQHYMTVHGIP